MITLKIDKTKSKAFLDFMEKAPDKAGDSIDIAVRRVADALRNKSVKLAPYKTGNLRQSITIKHRKFRAEVGTNLVYARIHDQGGIIRPKRKRLLRFKVNNKWVVARQVRIPKYKGRGYMTPAFQELARGRATKIFEQEIDKLLSL